MRILLDESLPRRLAQSLVGHTVETVVEAGWSGVKNGALLASAAARFEAFLTADRNVQYQQNLATLLLAVVVLVARDNRLETLLPLIPELLTLLIALQPNTLVRVGG